MDAMADVAPENMSCLHLVAAPGDKALQDCLTQALHGDAILFLDAGVLHLLSPCVSEAEQPRRAFLFAAADLEAHGLLASAQAAGVTIISDADLCGLLAEHAHCLTWT
jgi:sulfur relay protein TusB/DsrH